MRLPILILIFTVFTAANASERKDVVFADRYYISSVLSDIFGPNSDKILIENVLKNGNLFGGSCDIYDQLRSSADKSEIKNEFHRCFTGKQEFTYPPHAGPSLLRESWMIKTCTLLTKDPMTFAAAKNKLNISEITPETIIKIQKEFDPNFTLNLKMNEALLSKVKKFQKDEDRLRFILYQTCVFPGWQTI